MRRETAQLARTDGRNWEELGIVELALFSELLRAAAGLSTAVAAADNELVTQDQCTLDFAESVVKLGSSLVGSYSISGLYWKSDSQLHIGSHSFTSRQKLADSQLFLRLAIQEGAKALVVTLITTNNYNALNCQRRSI